MYTHHVGTKFNRDGTARTFPGNTVISKIGSDMPVYAALVEAQNRLKSLECAQKYAFLPPASFHMTVIEGLCDQVRKPKNWTTKLALDLPLVDTNKFLIDLFPLITPPDLVEMRIAGRGGTGVLMIMLEPADKESMIAMTAYRDRFADETGIRFPGHDDYKFHISLAYNLIELTESEERQLTQTYASVLHDISTTIGSFRLNPPSLACFENMLTFNDLPDR